MKNIASSRVLNLLFGRMRLKLVAVLAVIVAAISLMAPRIATAATFQLSGTIRDSASVAMGGATVDVINSSNTTVGTATSDSGGNYALAIEPGTYKIQVTPAAGSGYAPIIALDRTINTDTVLDFVFAPQGQVTVSGRLRDGLGQPLSSQTVFLQNNQGRVETTTDNDGNYSLQANPGIYQFFQVAGGNNGDPTRAVPDSYDMYLPNYVLNQSTVLDIKVPAVKLSVHVQTPAGAASSDTQVNAGVPQNNFANGGGLSFSTSVGGGFGHASSSRTTNGNGDVSMWLFPNTNFAGHFYSITANPPQNSGFLQTIMPGVFITGDTSKTITLNAGLATVKGHVYNQSGTPLPNVSVYLGSSNQGGVTTDTNGYYEFQALPNTYIFFGVRSNGQLPELPAAFDIYRPNYNLTGSTTVDFTIPAKRVTVHIRDTLGNPVSGVSVSTTSSNGASPYGGFVNQGGLNFSTIGGGHARSANSGTSDGDGDIEMWLLPNDNFSPNFYDFVASPPSGSPLLVTTLNDIRITGDRELTITMNAQPAILNGHVRNSIGEPLADQTIQLVGQNNGIVTSAVTDANGAYSLQALPNVYLMLKISGSGNPSSTKVPAAYEIYIPNYALTGSTSIDFAIPGKRVTVQVQNSQGDPVEGVSIEATSSNGAGPYGGFVNQGGIDLGGISGGYARNLNNGATDADGNVTMWLLPNDDFQPNFYDFGATPPTGSIYAPFTVNNVRITTDQTEIISLQYIHDAPETAVTLSPVPDAQDEIAGPATVTLSATAAQGFTVDKTYYTLDGGAAQTYMAPFAVSTGGPHTLTYWSVDSAGVPEAPKSKNFTINLRSLSALAPAQVWITTKKDKDNIKFDLRAEVYKGATLVSSGQVNSFSTEGNGFGHATQVAIPFNSFPPVAFPVGSQLQFKLSARNACADSTNTDGEARLWFDDSVANSRFGVTIDGNSNTYYLRDAFALATTAGPGPMQTINVEDGTPCSPFKPFGTWTVTP